MTTSALAPENDTLASFSAGLLMSERGMLNDAGGTTINRDAYGNFLSETGWSGSGGGRSIYEGPALA